MAAYAALAFVGFVILFMIYCVVSGVLEEKSRRAKTAAAAGTTTTVSAEAKDDDPSDTMGCWSASDSSWLARETVRGQFDISSPLYGMFH